MSSQVRVARNAHRGTPASVSSSRRNSRGPSVTAGLALIKQRQMSSTHYSSSIFVRKLMWNCSYPSPLLRFDVARIVADAGRSDAM